MYVLWSELNTKPWEVNGGIVYLEDVQAMLKMLKMHHDKERMEREKAEQKARARGRGAGGSAGRRHR